MGEGQSSHGHIRALLALALWFLGGISADGGWCTLRFHGLQGSTEDSTWECHCY